MTKVRLKKQKFFGSFFQKRTFFLVFRSIRILGGLETWQESSLVVLSCPGPLRRHKAALVSMEQLVLPQVFLGGEAQLLAFVAASPAPLRKKMMFAPLPEMFTSRASLPGTGAVAHLRFGSVRESRVLKGVTNAAVLAEAESRPPLTASHHPFASGRLLPAAMSEVFVYGENCLRPRRIGGDELPVRVLPPECLDADIAAAPRGGRAEGLEMVALADFEDDTWLAGRTAKLPARALADGRAVLVPWNMAHIGSIIPLLLERLASLWQDGAVMPILVVLPFNYAGHEEGLPTLRKRLATATAHPASLLKNIFVGRVTHPRGLARLKKTLGNAWVDGNDPEHGWTIGRLIACGIDPVVIDPGVAGLAGVRRIAADEAVWVESDTRYGPLSADVRLPSLRALPTLLALSS